MPQNRELPIGIKFIGIAGLAAGISALAAELMMPVLHPGINENRNAVERTLGSPENTSSRPYSPRELKRELERYACENTRATLQDYSDNPTVIFHAMGAASYSLDFNQRYGFEVTLSALTEACPEFREAVQRVLSENNPSALIHLQWAAEASCRWKNSEAARSECLDRELAAVGGPSHSNLVQKTGINTLESNAPLKRTKSK